MRYQNIRAMLESNNQDSQIKALIMLYNNPNTDLKQDLQNIIGSNAPPVVTSFAEKALAKLCAVCDMLADTDEGVSIDFPQYPVEEKIKALRAIKHGQANIALPLEVVIEIYYLERNTKVRLIFAEILAKKYPSRVITLIAEELGDPENPLHICAMLIAVFLQQEKRLNVITDLFNHSNDEAFLIAASKFLWKRSRLAVISRLRSLAVDGQTPQRIIASTICRILNDNDLRGILEYLMEDPNDIIRNNAKASFLRLPSVTPEKSFVLPDSSDIFDKLTTILSSGESSVQQKISVIKILDNLRKTEFAEVISGLLEKEQDPFLVSAAVKFLGKYGKDTYFERLLEFLKQGDTRVVANCLEGLSYCNPLYTSEVMKKYVSNPNHRISAAAALALWNFGEKDFMHDFLAYATNSAELWWRKAACHILLSVRDQEFTEYVEVLKADKSPEIREKILKFYESVEDSASPEQKIMNFILETGQVPQKFMEEKIEVIRDGSLDLNVRIASVTVLGYMVTPEHIPQITGLFQDKSLHHSIRNELMRIRTMVDPHPLSFLIECCHDEMPEIRACALEFVLDHDCSYWIDELLPLLYDQSTKVALNAAVVLHKNDTRKVYDKIRMMVLSPEKEDRMLALEAIMKLKTEQLFQLALYLLNDPEPGVAVQASWTVAELKRLKGFAIPDKSSEAGISLKETPIEILVSISEIANPEEIEIRMAALQEMISEEDLAGILSFMETTSNVVILSKLVKLLGRFCRDERVVAMIEKLLNHPYERVVANSIESLASASDPILFSTLVNRLDISSGREIIAIKKLFAVHEGYKEKLYQHLLQQNPDQHLLRIIPEELVNRYTGSAQGDPIVKKKLLAMRNQSSKEHG